MSEIDLSKIDLYATFPPTTIAVDIEGMGKMFTRVTNLGTAIAQVFCLLSGEIVYVENFLKRVVVTGFDVSSNCIKVRITE